MSSTVVLCGSLGSAATIWDSQIPALDGRRVVRIDYPGHGTAPLADVQEIGDLATLVLDAVGDGAFSFVGLSLGGAVGMQLALTAPERVERLVLACTAARFGDPAQWLDRAALVRAEGLESIVDAVLARWFTPQFTGVGAYRDMLLSIDPEGYARCCDALARWDVRGALSPVRAPTLVIAGADDPSTPPDTARGDRRGDPGGALRGDRRRRPHRKRGAGRCVQPTDRGASVSNEDGMKVRREVLGDEHVDAAIERTTEFTADFQDLITRYAWGEIWSRPGLDRRTRSAVTLTALVALNHHEELAMHVRAALRNGLTPDEIKEVLLQTAIYCGVPAANRAFAIAQQVLDES